MHSRGLIQNCTQPSSTMFATCRFLLVAISIGYYLVTGQQEEDYESHRLAAPEPRNLEKSFRDATNEAIQQLTFVNRWDNLFYEEGNKDEPDDVKFDIRRHNLKIANYVLMNFTYYYEVMWRELKEKWRKLEPHEKADITGEQHFAHEIGRHIR